MNGRKRLDWEETALRLAFDIAKYRSEDPYVQVGACGIKHDSSIILGYNGAPPNVNIDWADRDNRRKRVIHAEENLLGRVLPNELKIVAVTALPCPSCMRIIAQKGVKRVIYGSLLPNYDNQLSFDLAKEFGIELKLLKL